MRYIEKIKLIRPNIFSILDFFSKTGIRNIELFGLESIDIDTEEDFLIAESILLNRTEYVRSTFIPRQGYSNTSDITTRVS